jgi:arsenite methyltransferase
MYCCPPAGWARPALPTAWMRALTCSLWPARVGEANARFLLRHIEDIPLPGDAVDVVISNCVVSLSADKPRVLAETFRVLRPGGRLGISDIIADEHLDPGPRADAEAAVGCACGTLTASEYKDALAAAGFTNARITITNDAGGGLHSASIKAVKAGLPELMDSH